MPYYREGNCVKKEGSGETVKCHPSVEEAEKHLTALRINVEANLILGSIKFYASDDPRFLRFKDAVLARAETNGNQDAVTEKELQEVASTLTGTAIDLEHADTDNYGVFTAARVAPDPDFVQAPNIPTLFVDGYFWRHRLEARGISPEDLEGPNAKYKLSIEADAEEAECSVCHKTFKGAKEYCQHIDGIAHKIRYGATRILRGLRAMGGALTRSPAGTDAGFSKSTIYMIASHQEANIAEDDVNEMDCSDRDFYAILACMMDYEDDDEFHTVMAELS